VKETGSTILEQLKMIGASCDWSRTRFTLDPSYSRAVREDVRASVGGGAHLSRPSGDPLVPALPHGLVGRRAESKDIDGKLYYIRYPVEGGPKPYLTVATTRPETLLATRPWR